MSLEQSLEKALEAFNRHDAAGFSALYAPDATVRDPQYPEPLRGREAIRKDMEDFFTAFPDLRATVRSMFVKENEWALELEMSGTHTGPMAGPSGEIGPTGKAVVMPGVMLGRFNDGGEVVEERRYYDLAGLLGQLGLMS